jgi:hypothetical protein
VGSSVVARPAPAEARCANGSSTDCNVPGTTLAPLSAWVDPEPPSGFVQCAGFLNTSGDDVAESFLDGCLGASALRIRVLDPDGGLEDEVIVEGMTAAAAWPNFDYLGGEPLAEKRTHWGTTSFFTTTDGRDACMQPAARRGTTFGTGNGSVAVLAGANTGADEYRISCGGADLPGRRVAVYRRRADTLEVAR